MVGLIRRQGVFWIMLLAAIVLSQIALHSVSAQDSGSTDSAKPDDAKTEESKDAEKSVVEIAKELVGKLKRKTPFDDERDLPTNERIRKEINFRYPNLDLNGKHNITNIANPSEPKEREAYTKAMLDVVEVWNALELGGRVEVILAEQYEEKKDQPVYRTIRAFQSMLYPFEFDGRSKAVSDILISELNVALRESKLEGEEASNFAAPTILLARCFREMPNHQDDALRAVNHALSLVPKSNECRLLKAQILQNNLNSFQNAKEEALQLCQEVIDSGDASETFYNWSLTLLSDFQSTEDFEAYLNDLLKKELTDIHRAIVLMHLGMLRIQQKRSVDALDFATQAMSLYNHEKYPEMALSMLRRLKARALEYSLFQAHENEESEEKVKKLEADFIDVLKSMVDFDLKHLPTSVQSKTIAVLKLATELKEMGRVSESVAAMRNYDKNAAWLTRSQRIGIRDAIAQFESELSGAHPVDSWQAAESDSDGGAYLLRLLEKAAERTRTSEDPEKWRLDGPDTLAAIKRYIAHANRDIAAAGMRLASLAANQPNGVEARDSLIDTIAARMKNEKEGKTLDQSRIFLTAFSALGALGTRRSASVILDIIEGFDDLSKHTAFKEYALAEGIDKAWSAAAFTSEELGKKRYNELRDEKEFAKIANTSKWIKLMRNALNK